MSKKAEFLDLKVIDKIINGDYAALSASVAQSNAAIRQSTGETELSSEEKLLLQIRKRLHRVKLNFARAG